MATPLTGSQEVMVHGSTTGGSPEILCDIDYSVIKSGGTISASVTGVLGSCTANQWGRYFGYDLIVQARLVSGSTTGSAVTLLSKPSSVGNWNSGVYKGSGTCTVNSSTTSATLQIRVISDCDCNISSGITVASISLSNIPGNLEIYRYNGSNWVQVSAVSRYSSSGFREVSDVLRYNGSNWVSL